jgi:glycosidase
MIWMLAIVCFQPLLLAQKGPRPATNNNLEIYPSHWWVGMKNRNVQLMLHGKDIGNSYTNFSTDNPAVVVKKVFIPDNKNYIFIDLEIGNAVKPGSFNLLPSSMFAKINKKIPYELKPRREGKGTKYAQGVTSSDFIYFLMPDRFSNGDPSNDVIAGMKDQTLNRDSVYHRHGGDLQGVINHLDYIQGMGATALWMTPVIENDMPNRTEHGYAMTNQYKIDPRYGGNDMYKKLSDALHKRGMKLIQDAVYNHVGLWHFTVQDPPMKDWLHQWPAYTQTTYKDQPLFDPYASVADKTRMSNGWFTPQMPDMNQSNPYVANYLIQHAIWCVEEFGVDAWRVDTYIYNDLEFMNRCNKALLDEYPKLHIFGETWVHGVINQAFFVENNFSKAFKSNLPGATDFQANFYGIKPALTENFGWTDGVNKLYTTLASDLVYKDPMRNVIFLDNHDLTRFATIVNEDVAKLKMGIAWLLTCRGIPQMYYGTEIIMKGSTYPNDGFVRQDFPGGFSGDKKNAFTGEGLSAEEIEVQSYTKTLANFRKNSSAIKTGKMMQFVPEDAVYVYFRYDNTQTVMVAMNTDTVAKEIKLDRFAERIQDFTHAREVGAEASFALGTTLKVPAKHVMVLELSRKPSVDK